VATVADRILGHLAGAPAGLDDGKLAEAIGASRSSVNNACRKLAEQGRLVRAVGTDGKIVNKVPGAGAAEGAPPVSADIPVPTQPVAEQSLADATSPGEAAIPAARPGPDDLPGIPAARSPGDDEIPAQPVAVPIVADAAPTRAEPEIAEVEVADVEVAEPEFVEPAPTATAPEPTDPVAAEPASLAASVAEPADVDDVAAAEGESDVAAESDVAEAEIIAEPEMPAASSDDSDIEDVDVEDVETSGTPAAAVPPAAPAGEARRSWWRRLLQLG